MSIKLNHTIVHSRDQREAAEFLASLFGLPAPQPFGPFLDVDVANEVTLAFLDADGMEKIEPTSVIKVENVWIVGDKENLDLVK